jgi:hypothetical protein
MGFFSVWRKLFPVHQGCQIFMVHDTKTEKMCPMNTKWTKWSLNIPNVSKIYPIAIKFITISQSKALKNVSILGFLV